MADEPGDRGGLRQPAAGRLRLTTRSVVVAVVLLGVTFLLIRVFAASTRVLGWLAVAVIVAAALHPVVTRLDRYIPRSLAVATVMLVLVAVVGGLAYLSVDSIRRQADHLKEVAPQAAKELEQSDRWGDAARQFHLQEKVQRFVDELPRRLQGGDTASALRSAATRGVAYLATIVLTIFLLVHGQRLVQAGLAQVRDDERRVRMAWVLLGAYDRSVRYLGLTLLRAAAAGLFTGLVCRVAGIPAPVLLGIAAGIFSLVPMFGMLLGGLPVVLLTAALEPDRLLAVTVAFVAYQVFEALVVQPRLDRRSVHVGPVLSLLVMMIGLEAYGVGGMLVALVIVVFAVALVLELVPSDQGDLLQAADEVITGEEAADTGAGDAAAEGPGPRAV
jgi:predicted PurR-regulated permease PerM